MLVLAAVNYSFPGFAEMGLQVAKVSERDAMRYHVICESDLYPFASLFVLVKLTKANMSDCLTDVGLVADADAVTAVREYDYDSFSIDLRDGSIFLIYPFEFWERSGELPW